jgi:non-ribosomal peptide synthetase-like protein
VTTEVFQSSGLMAPGSPQASPDGFPAGTVCPGAVYPAATAPPPRTLWQVLEATAEAFPHAAAIDDGTSVLDYAGLLERVRQAGDGLSSVGIGAGDRVGIRVSSGAAELYVSILAVLSVGAAYVPVDVDDPDHRAELVWSAAGVCAVITGSGLTRRNAGLAGAAARPPAPQDDAWIIFTSGTTGTPKGVAVTHRSAAAFVDAEARLFLRDDPLGPGDRVMAGLSVAFDASCEEMWLAWRHGACLVPAHRSIVKTGPELAPWLVERRISVVSTVPTLASQWPAESLGGVRLLILGGEACPGGLADRLTTQGTLPAQGREVWNTYGPTEAAVVSCAARLSAGEPVRIGLPLDGWQLAVVSHADGQPVAWGEVGELIIGGTGVARYLDPDKDAVGFRPVEALGWERAYHTGDLVRADPEGLIFVGRADAQVKIIGGSAPWRTGQVPDQPAYPRARATGSQPATGQPLAGLLLDPGGPAEASVLASADTEGIRWRPGERLEDLFEERCDQLRRTNRDSDLIVDGPSGRMSYRELDARANQLARFLVARQGVRPGDRVALLFDEAVDGYLGMLAVLKAHAAYVPLDPGFPPDRLAYITSDSGARTVLSHSRLARLVPGGTRAVFLDEAAEQVAAEGDGRLGLDETGEQAGDLCYVIYTSGTTGRPKGVAVSHASICNFVRVAAATYGITDTDRVYQGLTMAFDFAIEETWVPWLSGATLVPKPRGASLLGRELAEFLTGQHVTALVCVPTLLATLDDDLPGLRFLLVSGESCPQELVERWDRPGRRFLNVYGPTEATVSATWTQLRSGAPVTIGVPLPTYSVVILDPDEDRVLPAGQAGEIGIGGIGLANGYLNLPDRTAAAFVPDFAGLPDNPSGRIYRTGDLGRINADGEVEHHGRIDSQVKIRGYRIELAEIESVLAQADQVMQTVVTTYEPAPGVTELAAYYRPRRDGRGADVGRLYAHLRERLPSYMVPAYIQEIAEIPVTPSGKVDRKSLPPPAGPRWQAGGGGHAEAEGVTEALLAGTLAVALGLDRVSAEADFFDELGANSLLMARFIAALPDGTPVSMRDVYEHRTVRRLATATGGGALTSDMPATPESLALGPPAGTRRFRLCGTLQVLTFLGLTGLTALVLNAGAGWVLAGHGAADVAARVVAFGVVLQVVLAALPIAAKWLLIGRWRPGRITIWSLGYVRFWFVKSLLQASPLALLSRGTALYNLYLRALGAKVGRGAVIFTSHVPVCTDLLTIGPHTVVRKKCYLNGYRARGGVIEIAPVTLGAGVFVGEQTVLDIGTAMENRTQLGHSSSLHAGQTIPAGECWHGSPARRADADCDYRGGLDAVCGTARRARYAAVRLALLLFVAGPIEAATGILLWTRPTPVLAAFPEPDWIGGAETLYCALVVTGLLVIATIPRLLTRLLTPGRVYPLYGFHYSVQRLISALSNNALYNNMFGDSAAITSYLRLIGYRLGHVEQTGSNFGTEVHHEVPTLTEIGRGTMVSDGLSIINADFSDTAFRVRPVVIGPRNYLGNGIAWPAGARVGANCLIATMAMVPISGPVREGVGLLGSPCFEIPRTVDRDRQFTEFNVERRRRRRIAAKTRHNAVTLALYQAMLLVLIAGVMAIALLPIGDSGWQGWAGTTGSIIADGVIMLALTTLAEHAVLGFRPLRPRFCSVYAKEYWQQERYWKVAWGMVLHAFDGTPVKPLLWRLLGVRMGRRVFDDGCSIVERSLTTVGDEVTLNMGTTIQGHSLEDGAFKSDRIKVGAGCTLGTGAFVHYAVIMGAGSLVEAESFVMKGSSIPAGARWLGNPATAAPTGRE